MCSAGQLPFTEDGKEWGLGLWGWGGHPERPHNLESGILALV